MKSFIFLLLIGLSTNVVADVDPNWKDPSARYSTTQHKVNRVTVEHKPVSNVQAACNNERKRLGKEPFQYSVDACTFWKQGITGNTCTIITGQTTSHAELGHELRHCFQGNFH